MIEDIEDRPKHDAGLLLLALLFAGIAGCGVSPVVGGTPGTLHAGSEGLSDFQVTIHQADGGAFRSLGFATTGPEGKFKLVTTGAKEALSLTPGEYRFTLESAGSPVRVPKEYAKADTTPLKVTWPVGDGNLDLDVSLNPPRSERDIPSSSSSRRTNS